MYDQRQAIKIPAFNKLRLNIIVTKIARCLIKKVINPGIVNGNPGWKMMQKMPSKHTHTWEAHSEI